jgi:tRNA pseudouridine38-40 synthase
VTTLKLTLEYDGTRYRGWQEQKNAVTVGGELRRALEEVFALPVELGGSGRTDAGVHALAQVAHVRLEATRLDLARLRAEVNERLPADIHVLRMDRAADRFHARHAAVARSYLYQVSRRRTAFAKRFVWWVREPIDVGTMSAAAQKLAGKHDFAAFCEKPQEQTSTLVVVQQCEVAEAGDLVLVRLVASHFLWKMVRRLVGALVRVGSAQLSQEEFVALVAAGVLPPSGESPARFTAPPSGLFLERVLYEGDAALAPPQPAIAISRLN